MILGSDEEYEWKNVSACHCEPFRVLIQNSLSNVEHYSKTHTRIIPKIKNEFEFIATKDYFFKKARHSIIFKSHQKQLRAQVLIDVADKVVYTHSAKRYLFATNRLNRASKANPANDEENGHCQWNADVGIDVQLGVQPEGGICANDDECPMRQVDDIHDAPDQ